MQAVRWQLKRCQGVFDMEAIHAIALTTDSEERVVQVKWVGLNDAETTWS